MQTILELKDISKRYGTFQALTNVSINIEKSSIVGIIGPSGSGKSTMIRCMNGLEEPDSGDIYFKGQKVVSDDAKSLMAIRKRIGMVFQQFNLLNRRTVFENVALPLELAGMDKSIITEKVHHVLKQVGLLDKKDHYPVALSGGQKQRVGIARALVTDICLLLCDEITSALDPETTQDILYLLKRLRDNLGISLIMITHEMQVVKEICDSVYVLEKGMIIESGSIETIFTNPQQMLTRSFTQSIFGKNIPKSIQDKLKNKPAAQIVYRLVFCGQVAREPLISKCIHEQGVFLNIISGFLDHIGSTQLGIMLVTVPNDGVYIDKTESFFKKNGVEIQHLGYID